MSVGSRLRHGWNAFLNRDDNEQPQQVYASYGGSNSRPDRVRFTSSNERSIISSIYNRISIDVAQIDIRHVRLDDQNRYIEDIDSGLNRCFNIEANIDQPARAFKQDYAMTLLESGTTCLVPVDTTLSPIMSGGYDILSMRLGVITQWFPQSVRVSVYNEQTGRREEVTLPKKVVAIVENPLYSVMNEPNSTLQRLIRKLSLLDFVDEQSSSGKLDLIIQLPYTTKTEVKRQQAEQRREEIEFQLKGSKYGIAYTDGTEKITQLNRPAENNLLAQIKDLKAQLYAELGLTEEIMNGTADEAAMLNYINRTIEPIVNAMVEAVRRTFLTKTARSQKQWILFFRDPFKLVPMSDLAELADKFTRNEIVSSNEFRGFIGLSPSNDPKADELRNSNMPHPEPTPLPEAPVDDVADPPVDPNQTIDDLSAGFDDQVNHILGGDGDGG